MHHWQARFARSSKRSGDDSAAWRIARDAERGLYGGRTVHAQRSVTIVKVYLELGAKRTFANAVDWPGWSRGARGESEALEALVRYGPRYANVVKRAAPRFMPVDGTSALSVVQRLSGNSGTDFGVPSVGLAGDDRPIKEVELAELIAILGACWSAFDRAATAAVGVELRKGPRGGGRALAKIVDHVLEADEAYIVQLGARPPGAGREQQERRAAGLRRAIVDALRARATGRPVAVPSRAKTPWTVRYFIRRCAWHVSSEPRIGSG